MSSECMSSPEAIVWAATSDESLSLSAVDATPSEVAKILSDNSSVVVHGLYFAAFLLVSRCASGDISAYGCSGNGKGPRAKLREIIRPADWPGLEFIFDDDDYRLSYYDRNIMLSFHNVVFDRRGVIKCFGTTRDVRDILAGKLLSVSNKAKAASPTQIVSKSTDSVLVGTTSNAAASRNPDGRSTDKRDTDAVFHIRSARKAIVRFRNSSPNLSAQKICQGCQ